jgi:hypothetical protein
MIYPIFHHSNIPLFRAMHILTSDIRGSEALVSLAPISEAQISVAPTSEVLTSGTI